MLAAESLVVGDWSADVGLLVVPTEEGRPELRAAADPSFVVWRGAARLPGAESAKVVDDRSILLRTPGRALHRFDPGEGGAMRVPGVEDVEGWSASAGQVAVWSDDTILVIGDGDRRAYRTPGTVAWAAALDDAGVVALVDTGSGTVLAALDETSQVTGQIDLGVRPPGLATAWGRSALFLTSSGRELISVRLPDLEVERRFDFRGPVTAIALSASSHEVYVARPGRIEAVDRITGDTRKLAELDGEIVELRAGIYGQQLLAFDGSAVFRISLTGERPVRLDVDWRADLPLGLPAGDVLALRGDTVYLVRASDDADPGPLTIVDGPVDAIWLPIRWNPSAERVAGPAATAERPETPTVEPQASDSVLAGSSQTEEPVDAQLEAAAEDRAPTDSVVAAFGAPAAGYYAVAMASPEADGVLELISALARSGYPTAVQRRRDDGGQLWYRALLGPYSVRERADAAARQLRRERGLDAWVTEVTAGTEGEF